MKQKLGYHHTAVLQAVSRLWFPGLPGHIETEKDAHERQHTKNYSFVCDNRSMTCIADKIHQLVVEDFGEQGEKDGYGVSWHYVVDEIIFKDEVRL